MSRSSRAWLTGVPYKDLPPISTWDVLLHDPRGGVCIACQADLSEIIQDAPSLSTIERLGLLLPGRGPAWGNPIDVLPWGFLGAMGVPYERQWLKGHGWGMAWLVLSFLTLGLAHGTWKLPETHVPER